MQTPPNTCPQCQSPIPADAPGGLCPACVLLGVAGPTNPSQSASANAPTLEEIAAAFPELEVLEIIGQGGMGIVFKARQPRLDRFVALKILPPALAAQPGFAERFTREARVLARLAHPHIVAIYDFGESAGFFYLIMEFVNGVNLRAAMRAGVKPEQALLLVPRICEALQFAHDHGVLHRDIKPENILLDTTGTPKLADFGIAKLAGEESMKTGLTATGAALGTAAYMAPEQVEKPATVDHRADIYSLGVVLYEMLTGELPLGRFAAPSEKSTVNRGVDDVVMRALEKERERRQQSAGEMKTEVENASTQPQSAAPALKSAACYICSPEHRFSLRGNFYIFTSKGHLALDATTLNFLSDAEQIRIPLRAILQIGIGHYSAFAKPVRLDFFSVVWDEAGVVRTRLFTPHQSPLSLAWETNNVVAEWAAAVRVAAGRVQGREPSFVPSGALNTRKPTALHLVALFVGIPMLFTVPLVFFVLYERSHVSSALVAAIFACFAILLIAFAFLRPKARPSAIPQPANGPDLNPWPKRIFLLILGLIGAPVILLAIGLIVPVLAQHSRELPMATVTRENWKPNERANPTPMLPQPIGNEPAPPTLLPPTPGGRMPGLPVPFPSPPRAEPGAMPMAVPSPMVEAEAAAPAIVVTPDRPPFIGRLPQGSIELVAIARHPSDGGSWWQMNGAPATEGPFINRVSKSGASAGRRAYEFIVHKRDLPGDVTLSWKAPDSLGSSAGGEPSLAVQPEKSLAGYEIILASFPEAIRATNVRAGIASGPWETLSENDPGHSAGISFSHAGEDWSLIQGSAIESKDGATIVTYACPTHENWERRVVAVVADGREVVASHASALNEQSEWRFDHLPLENVRQFRFQVRRYQWIEFRGVALAPSGKTVVSPNAAALQDEAVRIARERLNIVKTNVESAVAPAIEQTAAERDLAIAEARGDAVKIAEARIAYAEVRLVMLKANAQAGNVSASDVLEGEEALNNARLQLEEARRKSAPPPPAAR